MNFTINAYTIICMWIWGCEINRGLPIPNEMRGGGRGEGGCENLIVCGFKVQKVLIIG